MDTKKYQNVLTEAEVLEILRQTLNVDFRLLNYVIKPASDNPMGFLGEHYRIVADVSVSGQTKQFSYFVKKIPTEVPEHLEYAIGTKAFYKEVELYKTTFVDFKNAQKDIRDATKWRPEYYYSRGSDLFVLEDLSNQSYYMYPERCYMDEEHVMASLRVMAAMHAASFIFEEKFNAGKVSTLSPFFKRVGSGRATVGEVYAHLTFETEASDVKGHPGNTYHEAGMNGPVKLVEYLPRYSEEEKKLIREKLPDTMKLSFQLVKPSDRYKNVFVHGDLWANNLLFRKDDTGKVLDALIIDFQLARYAPPAHDIMMFLHLVQSKRFRQERQRSLLECYYSALSDELKKNSLKVDSILPWDTFLDSCNFYEDLGLTSKLFYYQMILAPSEITSKFLSSPELFTKTMLTDRTEMVVACFLKDELCRERVTEALDDVIERFILV